VTRPKEQELSRLERDLANSFGDVMYREGERLSATGHESRVFAGSG
jgi:hypothetical protein